VSFTERAVVDGRPAEGGDVALAVAARLGHFTAMQVRRRRVRGLDLHLARLRAATRELYGRDLDPDLVLSSLDLLLGDDVLDASVRVNVVKTGEVHVIASSGAPIDPPAAPQRLRSVVYQRFLPHIKHGGGFPTAHLVREAKEAGFDDALLVSGDGAVAEAAITNLGAYAGGRVVWPDAPMLHGITMRLMELGLARAGIAQERRPLKVSDLPSYDAVFLANSHGLAPVAQVDEFILPLDPAAMSRLNAVYEDTPWDPILRR
jgi:branched-subunit amino acid aminotransferase/4-amino-4-deoxychorismate lyase